MKHEATQPRGAKAVCRLFTPSWRQGVLSHVSCWWLPALVTVIGCWIVWHQMVLIVSPWWHSRHLSLEERYEDARWRHEAQVWLVKDRALNDPVVGLFVFSPEAPSEFQAAMRLNALAWPARFEMVWPRPDGRGLMSMQADDSMHPARATRHAEDGDRGPNEMLVRGEMSGIFVLALTGSEERWTPTEMVNVDRFEWTLLRRASYAPLPPSAPAPGAQEAADLALHSGDQATPLDIPSMGWLALGMLLLLAVGAGVGIAMTRLAGAYFTWWAVIPLGALGLSLSWWVALWILGAPGRAAALLAGIIMVLLSLVAAKLGRGSGSPPLNKTVFQHGLAGQRCSLIAVVGAVVVAAVVALGLLAAGVAPTDHPAGLGVWMLRARMIHDLGTVPLELWAEGWMTPSQPGYPPGWPVLLSWFSSLTGESFSEWRLQWVALSGWAALAILLAWRGATSDEVPWLVCAARLTLILSFVTCWRVWQPAYAGMPEIWVILSLLAGLTVLSRANSGTGSWGVFLLGGACLAVAAWLKREGILYGTILLSVWTVHQLVVAMETSVWQRLPGIVGAWVPFLAVVLGWGMTARAFALENHDFSVTWNTLSSDGFAHRMGLAVRSVGRAMIDTNIRFTGGGIGIGFVLLGSVACLVRRAVNSAAPCWRDWNHPLWVGSAALSGLLVWVLVFPFSTHAGTHFIWHLDATLPRLVLIPTSWLLWSAISNGRTTYRLRSGSKSSLTTVARSG